MHILFLTTYPGIRGPLPKINPLLIAALQSRDCNITVLPWGRHSDTESLAAKLFGRLGDNFRILKTIHLSHFDLIFIPTTHDEYALARDIPLLVTTYLYHNKKVLMFHGSKVDQLHGSRRPFFKFATKVLVKLCDAIMVLSSEEKKQWQQLFPDGYFSVVNNPYVRKIFLAPKKIYRSTPAGIHDIHLLFTGRLIKEKGIYDLLGALDLLKITGRYFLTIVGDGPEAEKIDLYIKDHNLGSCICRAGYCESEELKKQYVQADVFVLPTYFGEGFPTVIAEAMDAGVPIITTPIRGNLDLLREGVNAFFVKPKDPDELANAIQYLADQPDVRAKMSAENRIKILEFEPNRVVSDYLKVFHQVVATQEN